MSGRFILKLRGNTDGAHIMSAKHDDRRGHLLVVLDGQGRPNRAHARPVGGPMQCLRVHAVAQKAHASHKGPYKALED